MKHPKQVTSFNLGDWYYEFRDYQDPKVDKYLKLEHRKLCPQYISRAEFLKAKKEKENET